MFLSIYFLPLKIRAKKAVVSNLVETVSNLVILFTYLRQPFWGHCVHVRTHVDDVCADATASRPSLDFLSYIPQRVGEIPPWVGRKPHPIAALLGPTVYSLSLSLSLSLPTLGLLLSSSVVLGTLAR
jgi:hypothetical protein